MLKLRYVFKQLRSPCWLKAGMEQPLAWAIAHAYSEKHYNTGLVPKLLKSREVKHMLLCWTEPRNREEEKLVSNSGGRTQVSWTSISTLLHLEFFRATACCRLEKCLLWCDLGLCCLPKQSYIEINRRRYCHGCLLLDHHFLPHFFFLWKGSEACSACQATAVSSRES